MAISGSQLKKKQIKEICMCVFCVISFLTSFTIKTRSILSTLDSRALLLFTAGAFKEAALRRRFERRNRCRGWILGEEKYLLSATIKFSKKRENNQPWERGWHPVFDGKPRGNLKRTMPRYVFFCSSFV